MYAANKGDDRGDLLVCLAEGPRRGERREEFQKNTEEAQRLVSTVDFSTPGPILRKCADMHSPAVASLLSCPGARHRGQEEEDDDDADQDPIIPGGFRLGMGGMDPIRSCRALSLDVEDTYISPLLSQMIKSDVPSARGTFGCRGPAGSR